jgi:uncharacterized protein (DUF1800 family)
LINPTHTYLCADARAETLMSLEPQSAALALHRFGLGPRRGSIAAIAPDPRGALLAELDRPDIGQIDGGHLRTSAAAARAAFEFRAERRARQVVAQREAEERKRASADSNAMAPAPTETTAAKPEEPNVVRDIFRGEATARFAAALGAEIGFAERLVWFWSNHFCVSADKVPSFAGAYEREAIRPHVLGRFADILLAAEAHPAMLFYLDNAASIGPNSVAGINRSRGLNENLAREILELHTLGVRTGYSQDDVISFAKVLTGWSFTSVQVPEHGGEFNFIRRMHEPGAQIVLGKTYAHPDVEQGRAVLADLAQHPATAEHIAFKLARHFVADEPPPELVARLVKTFRATDGNLKEMARVLVTAPESWDGRRGKLKTPGEWIVAGLRAAGASEPNAERLLQAHALLGQPLWRPPSPKGYADDQGAWLDGMALRLDIANRFATQLAEALDPPELVDEVLGPLASNETRQTIARAESRTQAFALLLMSPEFQRR